MLTIAHLITGLETGGAERMLARLVAAGDRSRFRTVVISLTGLGTTGRQIAEAGIDLRTLAVQRGLPDLRALFRLRTILRELRPDIVQSWLYHADLLALLAHWLGGAPCLMWNLRATETVGSGVVRPLLARFSAIPDAVIVNSLAGKRFHQKLGYRPRRWLHIPNGFDTEALRPDPERRRQGRIELGLATEAIAILLPARYHPMKDHVTFLAAAARLAAQRQEVHFCLIGTGIEPGNQALASAIATHGLGGRVSLLGERSTLDTLYPAIDIASLSSAFGEGFPNVLAEAMCCEVPCVATDTGDAALIVGETGLIVPPRDPAALAAAWDRLIAIGAHGRRALGAAARQRMLANYDLAKVVSQYEAAYETIAAMP
jgi:glycosyltransferase involved in cell wall biosynthesis